MNAWHKPHALALRVAATLGNINSRWDKLTDRLSQARENMHVIRAKTLRRIRLAAVAIAMLVLWMGAGQVALSLYGWQGVRRVRTERPPRRVQAQLRKTARWPPPT